MTETLAHGYSSESTHRELSNEYQYDLVNMFFKNLCSIVLWRKVASALGGFGDIYLTNNSKDSEDFRRIQLQAHMEFLLFL